MGWECFFIVEAAFKLMHWKYSTESVREALITEYRQFVKVTKRGFNLFLLKKSFMRLEQNHFLKNSLALVPFFILIGTCALFHDKIESKKNVKEIPYERIGT